MKNYFKILFYIKKKQPLRNGEFSIMCRITINRRYCAFSTHLSTPLKLWNQARCRLVGRDESSKHTNAILDKIQLLLYDAYLKDLRLNSESDPQRVRRIYLGHNETVETIINFFDRYNHDFEQMVGVTRCRSTLYKYWYVRKHLQSFIGERYGRSDFPIGKIDHNFILEFHRWLAQSRNCSTNTIKVYMTAFKHIMVEASKYGVQTRIPFVGYRINSEAAHRSFLTKEELRRLIEYIPTSKTETVVVDAFLFCSFTGLSYTDAKQLTMSKIIREGGRQFITTHRQKTHTIVEVPLLELPKMIIDRYAGCDLLAPIFALPSNCQCNNIIARVMKSIEVDRHITFHAARHTFATTITLAQGIPIDVVSKMLGHTDIKTTQIYAKTMRATVSSEMERASSWLNSYFGKLSKNNFHNQP